MNNFIGGLGLGLLLPCPSSFGLIEAAESDIRDILEERKDTLDIVEPGTNCAPLTIL